MSTFWWVLGLVFLVVVGNAMVLLRSAKSAKPPESVKPKPYDGDENGGW